MGSEADTAHQNWYRLIAEHYASSYDPRRDPNAAVFLDHVFRRHGGIHDVLDVACGTFSIGLELVQRGYRVAGRDLSEDMIRVARRKLRARRLTADVGRADMRALRLPQRFDAVLCLGTAFNYLVNSGDVNRTLRAFHRLLRPGGLLILDLANFDAWIDTNPMNARADIDFRARDGSRIAVFAFNEQLRRKTIHIARFLTVVQRDKRIHIQFDEAPLTVWRKEELARQLRRSGFQPSDWWGDLRPGVRYVRRKSTRLVSIAVRSPNEVRAVIVT